MRLDRDSFREIVDALVRNKSRSLLTGFGIFWGLFMLLFLLGGGKGVKQLITKNFEGFASNAVVMFTMNTSMPYKGMPEGRYWSLQTSDIERLKILVSEFELVTGMVSQWGSMPLVYDEHTFDGNIKCVPAEYSKVEAPLLKYGRYLNEMDIKEERKVCVIGKRVYETLFPDGGDPCGKFVKAGSVYFQIVGVDFCTANISINGEADESVIIPFPVGQKLFNRGTTVDMICAVAKPGVKVKDLEPKIRQIIARQHIFDPKDESALMIINTQQLFTLVDTLFKGINFLLWLVGLGTLLAGAIGVSNIMMVTVKERTTEIGIRRAIGATPTDILSQIILESVTLTLIAGSAGIVFSVLTLRVLEMASSEGGEFMIGFGLAVAAALLLTLLGVIAGLAPASRAMNIKPVDAMRDE